MSKKREPLVIKDLKRETIQQRVNDLYEDIDLLEQNLQMKENEHAATIKLLESEKETHLK